MNKWQIVSKLAFSFSILVMSLSIFYFSWVIHSFNASLPLVTEKIEKASGAVNGAVNQVNTLSDDISFGLLEFEKFNAQIPKILLESTEIRRQTNLVVEEFSGFDDKIPLILAESQNIREGLPEVLEEIARTRETVESSVAEIRNVREELPGLMAEASMLIEKADKAGVKASEGAVSGVFTGIVKAPYNIIRNVVVRDDSGEKELTDREHKILSESVKELLTYESIGETLKFKNDATDLYGFVELVAQSIEQNRECKSVRVVIGKSHDVTKKICRNAENQWYLIEVP